MSDSQNAPEVGTELAHRNDDGEEDDGTSVAERVHRMARELGISLEEAERAVYAQTGQRLGARPQLVGSVNDLKPEMRAVSVRARVISVHEASRGEGKGTYFYGLLGDSGGDINFCSWTDFPFSPGDPVMVQNGSVREWNGKVELVIGDHSTVTGIMDTQDLLPDVEDSVPMSVSEVCDGMKNADLQGRVIELREVSGIVKGAPRTVVNGTLLDSSGRIGFTCWGAIDLVDGACYRIVGGTVRAYQGSIKLNFDPGAIVKPMPDDSMPPLTELMRPAQFRVHLLQDGLLPGPVTIRGVVVDIRPGSGLVRKCCECGRRVTKGQCTVHGRVEGEDDLRLRAVLDDGTGTIMARSGRSIVEGILDRDMASLLMEARSNLSSDFVVEELKERMVGRTWTMTGDPSMDEYGPSLTLSNAEPGLDHAMLMEEVISMAEVLR